MADDRVKILEERLTRLEAALTQQQQQPTARPGGFTSPGGVVVDPAPFPGGWGRPRPFPTPIVDPAPWPYWGGGWGHHYPWPTPVVDPAPWPNPVVDPAPSVDPIRATVAANIGRIGPIGPIGDPAPIDISRFTIAQLESSLHSINAEQARLNSMETLIKQQLDKLRPQKKG